MLALEVLDKAGKALEQAKSELDLAMKAVESYQGEDLAERARLDADALPHQAPRRRDRTPERASGVAH